MKNSKSQAIENKKENSPKWETKKGYYITATRGTAKKSKNSSWGQLSYEQEPHLYKRHKVPETHEILTHSRFAGKSNFKKDYDKGKI